MAEGSVTLPWWLRAARMVGWCGVFWRYVPLHASYLVRKSCREAGYAWDVGGGGCTRGVMWTATLHLPVRATGDVTRQRWRVQWMNVATRFGTTHTRWVNESEDAWAWLVIAIVEPVWAALHEDGEDPWTLLAAVPRDELVDAFEAMNWDGPVCGESPTDRMLKRHEAARMEAARQRATEGYR